MSLNDKGVPDQNQVYKLMQESGIACDNSDLDLFFKLVGGKQAHQLIQAGKHKVLAFESSTAQPVE